MAPQEAPEAALIASPKPANTAAARKQARLAIKEAAQLREGERICTAVKKTGQRCKAWAIKGGFVCVTHGGSAPQVRAKANKRLLAMVEPSLVRLEALIWQNEHPPTALGAVRTVLERAGNNPIGTLQKDTGERETRPIINIGIAVGGLDLANVKVIAKQLPAATDADVIEDDDESDPDDPDE